MNILHVQSYFMSYVLDLIRLLNIEKSKQLHKTTKLTNQPHTFRNEVTVKRKHMSDFSRKSIPLLQF